MGRRSNEKGNEFEWLVARTLSAWLHPDGERTELIRSMQSGGWQDRTLPQVGDLAPNGEYGREFRERFGVECKHWKLIDFWHYWTSPASEFRFYWDKHAGECLNVGLLPLYIVRMNFRPILVGYHYTLQAPCPRTVLFPEWEMALVQLTDFLGREPEWYYDRWTLDATRRRGQ